MSSTVGPLAVERARELIAQAHDAFAMLTGALAACPTTELESVAAEIGAVRLAAENTLVEVTHEAVDRGRPFDTGATSPGHWLEQSVGTTLPSGEARRIGTVATAIDAPANAPLRRALAAREFGVELAACVLQQHHHFRTSLPWEMHDDMLRHLVTLAAAGYSPRELRDWRRRMIADYGHQGLLDKEQKTLATKRSMSEFVEHGDGMFQAKITLDPVSYAQIAPALDALSAPTPATEENGTVIRDARSPEQRRADAFVELCVAYPGLTGDGIRLSGKTKVIVTMNYQDLVDQTGCGTTPTGQPLSPSAVRHLACDAGILPLVLDGPSGAIDVGREERLATATQITALRHRDKGCTYPGCGRPSAWCKAHHIIHWADGGTTDLSNLTLLCQHHHSHVHRHGLTATVDDTGVHWHLHPGALGSRAA